MYPPAAFDRPYVSPYLRRRCRSLEEIEAAHRDGAALPCGTDNARPTVIRLPEPRGQAVTGTPGPLHHHAQPKGGE